MDNLKLHQEGKGDYLKQLEIEYNQKIKEIENDKELSQMDKEQTIQGLKGEHKKLKNQSTNNLF